MAPRRSSNERRKPVQELDLHGLDREAAGRALGRELHACRVAGRRTLVVITGRGWGNAGQQPVLRAHLEQWLATPAARELGVLSFQRVHRGGALELRLAGPAERAPADQ